MTAVLFVRVLEPAASLMTRRVLLALKRRAETHGAAEAGRSQVA